jgi:hypothetical protein
MTAERFDDDRVVSVQLGLLGTPSGAMAWLVIGRNAADNPVYVRQLGPGDKSLDEARAELETLLAEHGRVFKRVPIPRAWLGAWEDRSPGARKLTG